MRLFLKVFIILCFAFPVAANEAEPPPFDPVQEIVQGHKKTKTLNSVSFGDQKKAESEESPKKEENDDDATLWNKYKEVEENTEDKEHEPQEESKEEKKTESDVKDKPSEGEEKKGLAAILERYKQSQKKKGGMNSRTFGNLDR